MNSAVVTTAISDPMMPGRGVTPQGWDLMTRPTRNGVEPKYDLERLTQTLEYNRLDRTHPGTVLRAGKVQVTAYHTAGRDADQEDDATLIAVIGH